MGASSMKPQGPHPQKRLSALFVRNIAGPGCFADGNGLYLIVDPSGAKRWMLRTMVQGKRRDIGLGGLSLVCLAEAREEAAKLRKVARQGGNPLAERQKAKQLTPTFEEAAIEVHKGRASAWRNPKHRAQWINTLRDYAFPKIGKKRVDQIDTADVLNVLAPIWLEKAETARRLRQRISTVMDWARAAGFRSEDNPVHAVSKGLPKHDRGKNHHAAVRYQDVPDFVQLLRESDAAPATKLAFEFLILTAARTGEVIGARWDEINDVEWLWTIPPHRMKGKRQHVIPLSKRSVEILWIAQPLRPTSQFVFSGQSSEKPLSNMTFLMLMRRMGFAAVPHGFRSSFRDWTSEQTSFPNEVCEMALAHAIRDKAEAAYRRGDLLGKRRKLMEVWSNYVCSF